jgi:hypothetical protein
MVVFIALNIITVNVGNIGFGIFRSCKRCFDRGGSCSDDRKTK